MFIITRVITREPKTEKGRAIIRRGAIGIREKKKHLCYLV
jgi:hypothetical protein